MADEIRVTPKELRSQSEALNNYKGQFKNLVQTMVGYVQQLDGMWDGEAKAQFKNAFQTDQGKMDLFEQNLGNYVTAMLEIAEHYETAESAATAIASQRNS